MLFLLLAARSALRLPGPLVRILELVPLGMAAVTFKSMVLPLVGSSWGLFSFATPLDDTALPTLPLPVLVHNGGKVPFIFIFGSSSGSLSSVDADGMAVE